MVNPLPQSHQNPAIDSADFFEQAIQKLREQVWVGFLLFTLFTLIATRLVRYNAGVKSTATALFIQVTMYSIIFVALWLRKTKYTQMTQTVFVTLMHMIVPVVIFFYGGGVQGFGDIALYMTALVSMLFGWRRWMTVSFGFSMLSLIYVYYGEFVGESLDPFLENTARFADLKTLVFIGFVGFTIYYGNRFFQQLVERHRSFADQQVQLTSELKGTDRELSLLTDNLTLTNQQLITAQETERLRLRQKLNDDLDPALSMLRFETKQAQDLLNREPDQAELKLINLENEIETVLVNIRKFVYALRPPMLDQLGLSGAIREIGQNAGGLFSLEYDLPEKQPFGAATEVACFSIIQAVFNYLIQNASGQKYTISVAGNDSLITLNIREVNGTHLAEYAAGSDFSKIKSWAEELTGTLKLVSHGSQTAVLEAQMPNTLDIDDKKKEIMKA